MPLFSVHATFGQLRFSSQTSRAQVYYETFLDLKRGAFDVTEATYQECKSYAQAQGLATARNALERAQNQLDPFTCVEMLPQLEKDWGCIPNQTDTLLDRQTRVAVQMVVAQGSIRSAVETGLRGILGANFIALRVVQPSEALFDNAESNFAAQGLPFKIVRLTTPVSTTGASFTVDYEKLHDYFPDIELQEGDVLTVQPENWSLREVVTVESATATTFVATFLNAHDVGSVATSQNYPAWTTNQRTFFVVAKHAACVDPETVRRVDDFMDRVVKGTSVWGIVEPNAPGGTTIGPFTLDYSPLGTTPMGEMDIYP